MVKISENRETNNKKYISRLYNSNKLDLKYFCELNNIEFEFLYCTKCENKITPFFSNNCAPYYKYYENKYRPLVCTVCFDIHKQNNRNSYKSIEILYGIDALDLFKDKTKGTYDNFIKRHGENAVEKFEIFKNKSKHTKQKFIEEYGESEGIIKWKVYIDSKKKTSKRSLNYWLLETNGNELLAKQKLHEYQSKTKLSDFIDRHGLENGVELYKLNCEKTNVKETYIKKYGEIDGLNRYAKIFGFENHNERMQHRLKNYTELFYDKNYRLIIFRDQHFKCGICGLSVGPNKGFDLHHIDYDKQNDSRNNLIWLCDSCHCKTSVSNKNKKLEFFETIFNINEKFVNESKLKTQLEVVYEKYGK